MRTEPAPSLFRVEKDRIDAIITLSNGDSAPGHFFVAKASAHMAGRERVGELLNAERSFFPFETLDGLATELFVSVRLSSGQRVAGAVRVYRPEGHHRLSDWARHADAFRYLELPNSTLLVNIAHVIEVSEVPRP